MPEWEAVWIWGPEEDAAQNTYVYARRVFELEAAPTQAHLRCCADSRYAVYVNGRFVGRGPVRYHVSSPFYDVYEVAAELQPGRNVIAILAHHIGVPVNSFMCVRPALLAQLDIDSPDGKMVVATGPDWKVQPAAAYSRSTSRLSEHLGFAEVFDSRVEPPGWNTVDFDDSKWADARVVGPVGMDPWTEMVEREIPPLEESIVLPLSVREVGEAAPPADVDPLAPTAVGPLLACSEHLGLGTAKVKQRTAMIFPDDRDTVFLPPTVGGAVYAVVDFEREVVGYPFVEVEGEPGAVLDMGYSESLSDGRAVCEEHGVCCADRVTLNGRRITHEVFAPRAVRFMHLEVRNATQPVRVRRVGVRFSAYPVEKSGSFECSDPVLNQVWDVGCYTARLSMQDAFEGCPWRGPGQWMCDARVEALTAYYAFGDTKLIRQCLRQMGQGQLPSGLTPAVYPAMQPPVFPDFTCMWVSALWEYYMHSGDRELIRDMLSRVKRALAWFDDHKTEYGTLTGVPGYLTDDPTETCTVGESTIRNCFYLSALRDASRLAGAVGAGDDAVRFQDEADALAAAIRERLYDPSRHIYADERTAQGLGESFSQLGNALAMCLGLVPQEDVDDLLTQLMDAQRSPDSGSAPHFSFCFMRAVLAVGRYERAIQYLRERVGTLLDVGARTTWELWYPSPGRCHAWCGGPAYVLSSEVLGIKPVSAGFRVFSAKPRCFDLDWAKGAVPTPAGQVRVSWTRASTADDFCLWIEVPPETVARVGIPEPQANYWDTIDLNECPAWRHDGPTRGNPHVLKAWVEPGYVVFEVGPGSYAFDARA